MESAALLRCWNTTSLWLGPWWYGVSQFADWPITKQGNQCPQTMCWYLLESKSSAPPLGWSAEGSTKCSKAYCQKPVLTLDLIKHSVRRHQHMTWLCKPSATVETLFCVSPLFSNDIYIYSHLKRGLWTTWATIRSFLSLAQNETPQTLSLGQEWLTDTRTATVWVSRICLRQSSPHEALHILEWASFHNPLKFVVIPVARAPFSTVFLLSIQLSLNVLWYETQRAAGLFSNDLLCLTLPWQGVKERLLDNFQVSSLPMTVSPPEPD